MYVYILTFLHSSIYLPLHFVIPGSGVIHMIGGFAGLCGAVVVGPRAGRWDWSSVVEEEFVPHNIPYCVLGTLLLWTGWYGFNPGSTGSLHDAKTAETAGLTTVNTTLAPCVCGLVVFLIPYAPEKYKYHASLFF